MMTYSGRNTLKIFLRDISNWYVYDYVCFVCNSLLEVHGNIRNQFKVLRRTDKRNKDEGIDNIMGKYCALVKVIPQQAEVAQGVPGRLRPLICLTFGTTRVVVRQPYAPAAFTPEEIPGTHFQRLSRPQGTWFRRGEPRKKSSVTPPGIDPGTVRLVAQC